MRMRYKHVAIERPDITNIASRWESQYYRDGSWHSDKAKETHRRLEALGKNATASAICEIIGNDSWTTSSCDACYARIIVGVRITTEYGDGHTYCRQCIAEASQALQEEGV